MNKTLGGLLCALTVLYSCGSFAQVGGNLDLSTRWVGMPPERKSVNSVAEWIENPIEIKIKIAVTNLYAEVDSPLELWIGNERRTFYGAGIDELGNFVPTNYPPEIVSLAIRREYPMSIVCSNTGPNGSALFKLSDFSDPEGFVTLLTNASPDAVSSFLWSSFTSPGRNALTNVNSTYELKQTNLVQELNRVLRGLSIYDVSRFTGVTFSSETQDLLALNPTGHELVRLNRLLLQDAYYSFGTYYLPSCGPDNNSGTAEIYFSVQPPPELKISKKKPAPGYAVLIDRIELSPTAALTLEHPAEGNLSTNFGTIQVIKEKFGHWGLGDGCDDPRPAPGVGKWLSMGPGCTAETNRISLEWSVSLGRVFDGLAAGTLSFREPGLSRGSYTPYAIYYNAASSNIMSQVELVTTNYWGAGSTNTDEVLRQVWACQAFVDIVAPDTNQTLLKFYFPAQVATNKNEVGVYTNISGSPFVVWTILNPEPTTTNKLLIFESRNGVNTTNSLVKSSSTGGVTWTLTQGIGAVTRLETRAVSFEGSPATNRIEVNTVRYASGNPAYQCQETYRQYDWGWELKETRIPNSPSDLVTSYDYYDNREEAYGYYGYGQLKQIIYPDGYWEKRIYEYVGDSLWMEGLPINGALNYILTPYLDATGVEGEATSPENAYPNNSLFTKFTYGQGVGGVGGFRDSLQADGLHQMTAIGNLFETGRFPNNAGWGTGWAAEADGVETTSWTPFCEANAVSETGTLTYTYSDGAPTGLAGKPYQVKSYAGPKNPSRVYYYDHGIYDFSSSTFQLDPSNHLYTLEPTTNIYPDTRQTEIIYSSPPAETFGEYQIDSYEKIEDHLMATFPLAPNQTKRNVKVFQKGNLVQTEEYIYLQSGDVTETGQPVDPQWLLVNKVKYQSDTFGRVTNAFRLDPVTSQTRVLYSADYRGNSGVDGPLLLAETHETGERIDYAYDSLQRVITNVVIGFGGISNQINTCAYDACGVVLSNLVLAGSLSRAQSCLYDLAGRETNRLNADGVLSIKTYSSNNRIITNTLPGGQTIINEQYVDRRQKSVQGTAVVHRFFAYTNYYNEDLDIGIQWACTGHPWRKTTTSLGSPNSLRWTATGKDGSGFEALKISPVGDQSTNTIWTVSSYMDGYLISEVSSPGFPSRNYHYDQIGRVDGVQLSLGDSSSWATLSKSEMAWSGRVRQLSYSSVIQIGGNWYEVITNYSCLVENSLEKTIAGIQLQQLNGFQGSEIGRAISYDADTNQTIAVTYLDRANNKLTTVTTQPNTSSLSATNIIQSGLLQQASSLSVASPVKYFYDALGRTNRIQDSLGYSSYMTYDLVTGWLTSFKDNTGQTTTYQYYSTNEANAGKLKTQTEANGKKTYYSYTFRGELYRTWGDVSYPVESRYNQYGDLTNLITFRGGSGWTATTWPSATTGTGDNTYWVYDEASGALLEKRDAQGRKTTYTYDEVTGRLLTRTWQRMVGTNTLTVTNSYNGYGDLVELAYSDETPLVQWNNYNRLGMPCEVIDGSGTNTLVYDHAGRLVSSACNGGILEGITVSNHFHAAYGRDRLYVSGISTPVTNVFGYDAYGRLGSVANGIYSTTYGYLPNSDLLQSTTFKNNGSTKLTTTRSWQYGMRLGAISNVVGYLNVGSHNYQYDSLNRRTRATLEDDSYWQYTYNDRNELTYGRRYWSDNSPVSGQLYGYGYDNIGNRKNASSGGNIYGGGLRETTYTVNDLNQYTTILTPGYEDIVGMSLPSSAVTVNGGTADRKADYFHREISIANTNNPIWQDVTNISVNTTNTGGLVFPKYSQPLVYDEDGNLIFDGVWTYEWDGENRLKTMTMTNVSGIPNAQRKKLDFVYDYLNRRVQKVVSTWSGSAFSSPTTNQFVYDGWNALAEVDNTHTTLRSYMWGQDLSRTMTKAGGVGGLLLVTSHTGTATNGFVCYDGNGNVMALIDGANQKIIARYEYSPYGELLRSSGPLAATNPFRWSSKYGDDESGLLYYGNRYFSSALGKWVSRDPAQEQGGINLYLFVKNSPVLMFDSDGRWPTTANQWVVVGATAGVAADLFNLSSIPFSSGFSRGDTAALLTIGLNTQLGGALLKNIGGSVGFLTMYGAGKAAGQSWGSAVVYARLSAVKEVGNAFQHIVSGTSPSDPNSTEGLAYDFVRSSMRGDSGFADLDAALLGLSIANDNITSSLTLISGGFSFAMGDAAGFYSNLPSYVALNAWDMLDEISNNLP